MKNVLFLFQSFLRPKKKTNLVPVLIPVKPSKTKTDHGRLF